MEPQAGDEATGPAWLDDAPDFAHELYLEPDSSVTWVVGFRNGRAAQLTSLEWVDPLPSTDGQQFAEVGLEASFDGPAGPWSPMGPGPWSVRPTAR